MPGPPALTAAIDIHCHIFNVRDLPTYAFILDVAGDNAALRDIAAPVAKLVAEIATAAAPDYANERAVLLMLRANPALAPTIIHFSAAPEIRFAVGLQRFLDKYTSFTPIPGPLSSPPNDDFILNVLSTLFLPGVSITDEPADHRPGDRERAFACEPAEKRRRCRACSRRQRSISPHGSIPRRSKHSPLRWRSRPN